MNIFLIKILLVSVITTTILTGCSTNKSETINEEVSEDDHSEQVEIKTIWTDELELFMEYDILIKDKSSNFLIHLTDLFDFKPIIKGELIMEFVNESGGIEKFSIESPVRPGIYENSISLKQVGKYTLNLKLQSENKEKIISISDVNVYDSMPHLDTEETHTDNEISYLKEQQWVIDFKTEFASTRTLQTSIKANGEIMPKLQNYTNVSSNVEGIINYNKNRRFPSIGTIVRRGQVLAIVTPSVDANVSIQKIANDFKLAEAEFFRSMDLFENKSIPEKRLYEATLIYEEKKKIYESLLLNNNIEYDDMYIRSPISGYLEKVSVKLGDKVNYGQEMFTIVNPRSLILKVNVPSGFINKIKQVIDASFIVEGFQEEFKVSDLGGHKTSMSSTIDETNRTLPLYFEFRNPDNLLKIGMFAQVFLKMNDSKKYLTVPNSAIIDEEGQKTVYVQVEGESFVKKIIKTGIEDNGFIEIVDGLEVGDRIVSLGAYQLRLASLSPSSKIGSGHGH